MKIHSAIFKKFMLAFLKKSVYEAKRRKEAVKIKYTI